MSVDCTLHNKHMDVLLLKKRSHTISLVTFQTCQYFIAWNVITKMFLFRHWNFHKIIYSCDISISWFSYCIFYTKSRNNNLNAHYNLLHFFLDEKDFAKVMRKIGDRVIIQREATKYQYSLGKCIRNKQLK